MEMVQCVTSKNRVDVGGDSDHVTLRLGLQLPWPRFTRSQCFLF